MATLSDDRKREIRKGELAVAVKDLAAVLGVPVAGLAAKVDWVFWEFAAHQRKTWRSRDFEQQMREAWAEFEDDREKKLRRLIEHPATPPHERQAPDRHLRKRVQRHFHGDERLITLITLRRKSVKHDNEEPGKVEWSRRWAVQGHWRHQWYPSLQRHDWVYIHEYVKGPEDKPFIPSERRVFNFRR